MCLVKVREEPELVPYRVARRRRSFSPPRSSRISRTIIEERRPPSVLSHHTEKKTTTVSSPQAFQVPPPQPVPVFVQPQPPAPPPAPKPPPSPPQAHYVEVSPRSSHSMESDYIIREHEVRRERTRDFSPARSSYTDRSPKYETFRYVEPPEERYVPRERSLSSHYEDPRDSRQSYRSTRIEVNHSRNRLREY